MRVLICSMFACLFMISSAYAGTADEGWAAYEKGDYDKAKAILEPLANNGDTDAMRTLSLMHSGGKGYPKSRDQGCYWLIKAGEAGDIAAKYLAADCKSHLTAKDFIEHQRKRKAAEAAKAAQGK